MEGRREGRPGQLCDQGARGGEMMMVVMVVTITICSEHLVISLLSRYRHPPPHFSPDIEFFCHSQPENLSVKVLEPLKTFEMLTNRMLIEDIS